MSLTEAGNSADSSSTMITEELGDLLFSVVNVSEVSQG